MALTLEQTTRLEREKYHATGYEVILEHDSGERYLITYTRRRSYAGMRSAVWQNYFDELIAFLRARGMDDSARVEWDKSKKQERLSMHADKAPEWTIRFSGRTKRECIIEGELPRITQ